MKKIVFLLPLFLLVTSSYLRAQSWQTGEVVYLDGTAKDLTLRYDSYFELLKYRDNKGVEYNLSPEDVVSFEYGGRIYYSIPFNNGKLSFFRVEFEGKKCAVVTKDNSMNLMQYLSGAHSEKFAICKGFVGKDKVKLCLLQYHDIGFFDGKIPTLPGNNQRNRPYYKEITLQKGIFTINEEGLQLFTIFYDRNLIIGDYEDEMVLTSLKNIVKDEDHFQQLKKYRKVNDLRLDRLADVVEVFQYYDRLN